MNYNYYDFCPIPFSEMEIHNDGNVYVCCPNWNNYYSIGNIYKDSLENVWNSEKAIDLRKRVLSGDYSLCRKDKCYTLHDKNFYSEFKTDFKPKMENFPMKIKLGYDYECNIACSICRDEIKRYPESELKALDEKIDSFIIPMLKSAKILVINTHGDPFGSRHSRKVIKRAIEEYPELKFDFTTNGILCNKKMLDDLNVTSERIDTIRVSIHAATAKTYGKIVKNGEKLFDLLQENLEYISSLKSKHNFDFVLNFVVMANNYKEMPQFVEMSEKYNALPVFWEYKNDACAYTEFSNNLSVVDEKHKEHKNLIKVLHHPNMYKYPHCLYPMLYELQQKDITAPFQAFLNKFKKSVK